MYEIKTNHFEFNCERWRIYIRIGRLYLGSGRMGY